MTCRATRTAKRPATKKCARRPLPLRPAALAALPPLARCRAAHRCALPVVLPRVAALLCRSLCDMREQPHLAPPPHGPRAPPSAQYDDESAADSSVIESSEPKKSSKSKGAAKGASKKAAKPPKDADVSKKKKKANGEVLEARV
eukprot:5216103-Prymnesium_polylepis.3